MTFNFDVENYRTHLREQLKKNPQDLAVLTQLGALEFECFRESSEAVFLLESLLKIDPQNVLARFWLAMCYYYDYSDYTKAERLLREALKIDPNKAECLSLMAWILAKKKKFLKKAIETVEHALTFEPHWPMLHYQLAKFFIATGEKEAAKREIERALQIAPLDPKKITNEVERYYEQVVTGRSWRDMKKEFGILQDELLKSIEFPRGF